MLVLMNPQARAEDVQRVCAKIESLGFRAHPMPGAQRTAIGVTGNPGPIEPAEFESLPGVAEAIRVSKPYKLVSREVKSDDSLIRVGPAPVVGSPGSPNGGGAREDFVVAGRN